MSGLTGLHRHGAGPGGYVCNALDDDQEEKTNDAVHMHPSMGRKMLYLNETHTRKF